MTRQVQNFSFSKFVTSIFSASLLSLAAVGSASLIPSSVAFGQGQARQFTELTGEKTNEARVLAERGQTKDALKVLEDLIELPNLNAYERSTIFQMLGKYSYDLDRLGEAQYYFEQAMIAGGLLSEDAENIELVIAQLMIATGQYEEGAVRLEGYLNSVGTPKEKYIELLVNAQIQAGDYSKALLWAEKWIDSVRQKERRHYDILNFLYNNLNLTDRQTELVKEMITYWPEDKSLWRSWVGILSLQGRDEDAFEVTKIRYLRGHLESERELLRLVESHDFYEMPYQAAELLEREMAANRIAKTPERLQQLGNLFHRAREYERAIPPLEAAALKLDDVDTYASLGEALSNAGACEKAKLALQTAISKGYDAGKSWALTGKCYYDQTEKLERLKCNMTDAEMKEAPITQSRQAAIKAYKSVPFGADESENAVKWVQFIEADIEADERRCGFSYNPIHHCFQKIKQAYDARIFTENFELDDQSCGEYVEEYDAKYGVRQPH